MTGLRMTSGPRIGAGRHILGRWPARIGGPSADPLEVCDHVAKHVADCRAEDGENNQNDKHQKHNYDCVLHQALSGYGSAPVQRSSPPQDRSAPPSSSAAHTPRRAARLPSDWKIPIRFSYTPFFPACNGITTPGRMVSSLILPGDGHRSPHPVGGQKSQKPPCGVIKAGTRADTIGLLALDQARRGPSQSRPGTAREVGDQGVHSRGEGTGGSDAG